jgi:hypothetical protein
MYKKVVIDPGIKSIAILFEQEKQIYLFHNTNFSDILQENKGFLKIIREKLDVNDNIIFYFEKQFTFKNIYTEAFLSGFLKAVYKNAIIIRIQPYSKNEFCKKEYLFKYLKCRSKKIFKSFPQQFINEFDSYEKFVFENDEQKRINNLYITKKIKLDDYVDVLMYLLIIKKYPKYAVQNILKKVFIINFVYILN